MSLINVPLMSNNEDLRRQLRSRSRASEMGSVVNRGLNRRVDDDNASFLAPSIAPSMNTNLAGVPKFVRRREPPREPSHAGPSHRHSQRERSSSRRPPPPLVRNSPAASIDPEERVVPSPPSLVPSIRQRRQSSSSAAPRSDAGRSLRRSHRISKPTFDPSRDRIPGINIVEPSTTGPARLRDESPHSRSRSRSRPGPIIRLADDGSEVEMERVNPRELLGTTGQRRSSSKASSRMERSGSRGSLRRPTSHHSSSGHRSASRQSRRSQQSHRTPPALPQGFQPNSNPPLSRSNRFRGFVNRFPKASTMRNMGVVRKRITTLLPNGKKVEENVLVPIQGENHGRSRSRSQGRASLRAGSIRSHHSQMPNQGIPFPTQPPSRSHSHARARTPSIDMRPSDNRRFPSISQFRNIGNLPKMVDSGRAGWTRWRRGSGRKQTLDQGAVLLDPMQDVGRGRSSSRRRHSEDTVVPPRNQSRNRAIAHQRSRSLPRIPSRELRRIPSPVVVDGGGKRARTRTLSFGLGRDIGVGVLRKLGNMNSMKGRTWGRRGQNNEMLDVPGTLGRSNSRTRRVPLPNGGHVVSTRRSRSLPRVASQNNLSYSTSGRTRHDSLPTLPYTRSRRPSLKMFMPLSKFGRTNMENGGKMWDTGKTRKGKIIDIGAGNVNGHVPHMGRERDSPRDRRGNASYLRSFGRINRPPTIHPILATPNIFRPLRLTWDVRYPSLPRKYVKDAGLRRSLEEPATNPPVDTLLLLVPFLTTSGSSSAPNTWSRNRLRIPSRVATENFWSTAIHASGGTYITPLQVLKSLASLLRSPATPAEISNIPPPKQEEVERAYTKRVRAGEVMGQGNEHRERRVGMRRIDLLGRGVAWGGMECVSMAKLHGLDDVQLEADVAGRGGWVVRLGEVWI